jgi:predicted CopG family antitoxin
VIAITISLAAFEALQAMMPGTGAGAWPGPDGLIRIWVDRQFVERLGQMRSPGESYSDVILRLAQGDGGEQ